MTAQAATSSLSRSPATRLKRAQKLCRPTNTQSDCEGHPGYFKSARQRSQKPTVSRGQKKKATPSPAPRRSGNETCIAEGLRRGAKRCRAQAGGSSKIRLRTVGLVHGLLSFAVTRGLLGALLLRLLLKDCGRIDQRDRVLAEKGIRARRPPCAGEREDLAGTHGRRGAVGPHFHRLAGAWRTQHLYRQHRADLQGHGLSGS